MAQFNIQKAKREKIWAKIALMAPSGGGKTYSGLRLLSGMREELKKIGVETKILMLNTESSRGRYYANEFDYDIIDMGAPHSPQNYVDAIEYAVEQGYKLLLMDSTSPEWEGKGGCLELHVRAGGRYQDWSKVTPLHDGFLVAIADSPIHIVATMRGKDQYEITKTETGKMGVKKLGVGAKQRSGFEYEFTSTFNIDQSTSMATPQKDNTHLFEHEGDMLLTEKHGQKIIQWANSGEGYTIPVRNMKSDKEVMKEKQTEIVNLCIELGARDNKELMAILEPVEPSGNPNNIKDIKVLNKLFDDIQALKGE